MNEYLLYCYLDLPDAHKQGFFAGFHNDNVPYKNPINEYQKEYNRGYQSGMFLMEEGE